MKLHDIAVARARADIKFLLMKYDRSKTLKLIERDERPGRYVFIVTGPTHEVDLSLTAEGFRPSCSSG